MVVSAYVDAKAHSIQTQVLGGLDKFARAEEANHGDLLIRADGQRTPRPLQFATAAAFAASGLAIAGAGAALAGLPGAIAGGALGLYVASMAADPLQQALRAPAFQPHPDGTPPGERFQRLVQGSLRDFPSSRHVVCLAGHGNHEQVGPLFYDQAGGAKVEQIVLNTCLGGQLEVLSQLAPWARYVSASCQPIPALGLPLDGMFAPAQLDLSPRELASSFVDQASSLTPSFAAWDCEQFQSRLLPALDKLGHHLAHNVDRSQVKAALVRASSPDWLPSGRVDLGTFLAALPQEPLAQEALEAFRASLVHTQNEKTLTFHLSRERDDDSLPEGWREFLRAADFAVKPHWLTAPFC